MKRKPPVKQYKIEIYKNINNNLSEYIFVLSYSCYIPNWSMLFPYFYSKKDLFDYFSNIGVTQRQKRKIGQKISENIKNQIFGRESSIYFELPPLPRKNHNAIQKYRNTKFKERKKRNELLTCV